MVSTPSMATSRFISRDRINWVHSVRRQLASTQRYKKPRYSAALGISRTSGMASSSTRKPTQMVAAPLTKTLDLSFSLSRPNRMTAYATPRLTTGINRLVACCSRLDTPITSGESSA